MPEFIHSGSYTVVIADINYGGHVGNSKILDYFHNARLAFLEKAAQCSEMDIGDGLGLLLSESFVKYKAEIFHGEELDFFVCADKIRRSGFTLLYEIRRGDAVVAEGFTVMVAFSYEKRRVGRLPQKIRSSL